MLAALKKNLHNSNLDGRRADMFILSDMEGLEILEQILLGDEVIARKIVTGIFAGKMAP